MANWSRDKVDASNLNNGQEYTIDSDVSVEQLNSMVNSGLYSQDFVEALADTPVVENDDTGASPSVELVDNIKNGKTYKKFKFKNLSNATSKLYDATGENTDGAMTQKATTDALENVKTYTDNQIVSLKDELLGEGASDALDTIGELAVALKENEDVVKTLNDAVGSKANQSDLDETNTRVSTISNKVGENTLALANKVDRQSNSTSYSQVYSVLSNQTQTTLPATDTNVASSIVMRDANGNFKTSTPVTDTDVVNKAYADAIDSKVDNKVDKVSGKGLSTEDFTNSYKIKLEEIEPKAQRNVIANWKETDTTSDAYILNKPTIPTKTSELTNDSGYLKPSDVSSTYVAKTTTVNGKALSNNIELSASDVGALPTSTTYMKSVDITPIDTLNFRDQNSAVLDTIAAATSSLGGLMSRTDKAKLDGIKDDAQSKLDGIEENAQVNVQADWNVTDTSSDAYIKNKPVIPEGSILYDSLGQNTDGSVTQKVITDSLLAYKKSLAVSNTNATVSAITATLQGITDFTLYDGAEVYVKFTYGANFSDGVSRTLNINGTGAKSIRVVAPQNWTSYFKTNISANSIARFVYNASSDIWLIKELVSQGINTSASFKWLNAVNLAQSSGTDKAYYGEESISLSDSYVDKFANQNIAGVKNFTSTPTINGSNVATTSQIISEATINSKDTATLNSAKTYADGKVSALKEELLGPGTSEAIDTIYELATALQENESVVETLNSAISNKVDKVSGKGLSTNDYTTTEKNKLAGIASGAEVNVQADWSVTTTTSDAYIKNKPTIPTKTSQLTNDSGFITSYTETDPTVPAWAKASSKPSYSYSEITGKPTFATVATSGSYNDLANKPTIPSAITVDSALSTTSTNPVQNKVVNNALTLRALTDLSNVTYPQNLTGQTHTGTADRVRTTYISSDGKTWSRVWHSGWKEMGGTATANGGWQTITLPVSFSNANYKVVATYTKVTEDQVMVGVKINNKTASNFRLSVVWMNVSNMGYSNSPDTADWYACGY